MVFMHKEQPFGHDESYHVAVGVFPFRIPDGRQEVVSNKNCGTMVAIDLEDNSLAVVGSSVNNPVIFSKVAGNATAVISAEHGKRPLSDDEAQIVSCKRSKQVEQNTQKSSLLENPISGESFSASPHEDLSEREVDAVPEIIAAKATSNQWFACSVSDEETCLDSLDPSVKENLFPDFFYCYQRASGHNQFKEFYTPFFDCFPLKPVALGPNHQAEIPEWRANGYRSTTKNLNDCVFAMNSLTSIESADHLIDEADSDKWTGACVMPMPDTALLASDVSVLQQKTECSCLDEGSIRCVRQHVMEAREELRKILGHYKFMELGFCDMGEGIAQKWTEEEEQLFHEVVLSNPASLGEHFWDVLPEVFPTRTSKELVSYYFNVFILRKRADQNRSDPFNADSDNDEWEESYDGEFTIEEEDEDEDEDESEVDSLADQDEATEDKNEQEVFNDGDECEYNTAEENEGFCSVFERCITSKSDFLPSVQLIGKISDNCMHEQDIQDDSCTSYEGQQNVTDSFGGPVDILDTHHSLIEDHGLREYKNDNLSGDHECFDSHFDPKAWNLTFTCGAEKDNFLSTCSVIEEVCGREH